MTASIHVRREGDCLWVEPQTTHGDLITSPEVKALQAEIDRDDAGRLIFDLSQLPYFGSNVLELLILLGRHVGRGRLVIHHPSALGRDVLAAAQLDRVWPVADTAEEAMRLLHELE